jgi:alpha-glucosidase (family GH31 glycosyl hydrolase)
MPWLYEDLMDAVSRLFDLREQFVPYLYEQMQQCIKENWPLITPVFLKQPDYDREADCYMCGERILACPVFDEGKDSVTVTLPTFVSGWKLRGKGDIIKGGTELTVPCTPTDLPVWFETV